MYFNKAKGTKTRENLIVYSSSVSSHLLLFKYPKPNTAI